MDRIVIKNEQEVTPVKVRNRYSPQLNAGNASRPASRRPVNGMQSGAAGHDARGSTPDTFRLTAKESEIFLDIVAATSKITRHYEIFCLLQSKVQKFIPHQILISAWGDFNARRLGLDVISAIPHIRTGRIKACGVERVLKHAFTRWVAGGRRPMLLENAAARPITHSTCDCALHLAMRSMRSVLVHGIRNERDELDSLYVTLNPVSVMKGQEPERLCFLADTLVAQIDVAFRKVAALNAAGTKAGEYASRSSDNLSAREQEIVKWISDGKTNAEIGSILGISSFTVKNHAQRIFRKLEVTNRTEAVAKYRQENPPAP